MNKHVQSMKNAITGYQKTVRDQYAKMEHNRQIYLEEIAEEENKRIMEELKAQQQTAKDQVEAARAAGYADVDAWGQLDGSKITDDARLLEYDLVNPDQFQDMVQKYQDNSTMLQMLTKYAEKRNAATDGERSSWEGTGNAPSSGFVYYNDSSIPTMKSKKAELDAYANDAMYYISRLANDDPREMMAGPDSPMLAAGIEHFGE